ncbi:MAG: HoxN/HupN/NixA family nickel/cobalt transporter [Chloroflexota bacterium]|nr:MAG: HoxN/HupN/NixA family nickel/cobalt transporter [Chloroflexota bacterium]
MPVCGVRDAGALRRVATFWAEAPPDLRRRLIGIYAILIGFNIAVWAALLLSSVKYGLLLGLAPVAYGFGLRHAVDPDHIAAIDNTTRKLMQDGKRPVAVGFFFSLGHSTVVFFLSALIALSAAYVKTNLPQMKSVGGVIGTTVSGAFLIIIATINIVVLLDIYKTWRRVVKGGTYDDKTLDEYLQNRGLLARLFRPLLKVVSNSWNMYPIGILFGLGFDTASEVGILGMSATAGVGGMPVWFILLLPLLFVAGMSLVDTTDGIAMLGAYGWAYIRPVRKLYYNMNITLISILVALVVGGIEVLQVIGTETGTKSGLLGWASTLPFSVLGFYIVGIFMASWFVSVLVFKLRGIDRMDDNLIRASGIAGGKQ